MFPNPDVNPNLPDGTIGIPYSQTLTFIIPADTVIDLSTFFPGLPVISVEVIYFEAMAPVLLPAGLSAACEPSSCQVNGGSNGCMIIEGTPTEEGTTPVSVTGMYYLAIPASVPIIGGTTQTVPAIFTPYNIMINTGSVSLSESAQNNISAYPNPFCNNISFCFDSPGIQTLVISVFNASGQLVITSSFNAKAGENTMVIDTQSWDAGNYYYSVKQNGNTLNSGCITKE
ncbi:hypothetical protein SDC9_48394 [bioreactor metagenome]|uniref:Secretion system C-terminal sorting domain-containing protein n=1 Tax=bioreactor metagenome TaxID=1076179 RepID=A0A644WEX2_9ZZZZ